MTLPAQDTFTTGADALITVYSANWANVGGRSAPGISVQASTDTYRTSGADADNVARWSADTFNNNQYAQAVISAVTTSSTLAIGVAVRCRADTQVDYYLYYGNGIESQLAKVVNNSWAQLGSSANAFAASDTIRLEASGTSITPKLNGSTTGTPGTQTDEAITSGYAGVAGYGTSLSVRADDWEGGDLAGSEPTINKSETITVGESCTLAVSAPQVSKTDAVTVSESVTASLPGVPGVDLNISVTSNVAVNESVRLWTVATSPATITTTGTWIAPSGVTDVTVAVRGGGGGGSPNGSATARPGGGGGGGGYARARIAVTPGKSYTATVGAEVSGGAAGNPSSFVGDSSQTATAAGGSTTSTRTGAAGGAGSTSGGATQLAVYTGGAGGTAANTADNGGGGGGEGARSDATGDAGEANVTSTGGAGGTGGDGGDGGKGGDNTAAGATGTAPGGGGGGAGGTNDTAGGGARGEIVVTFVQAATPVVTDIVTVGEAVTLSLPVADVAASVADGIATNETVTARVGDLPLSLIDGVTVGEDVDVATGSPPDLEASVADTATLTEYVAAPPITGACIGGVLTVNATNTRYFENDAGPLVLAGFHTWYDVQDGGSSDPPAAFDWTAYLAALVSYGCNFTKLWFMETARDWPDAIQYFTPHPWLRTGPGNAADGKLKFDLTLFNQSYFDRLRLRAIQAGNAGIYVCVQLFQGWHVEQKGYSTGDPWAYHPFEDGNNVNSIDGDTDNDGAGEETRATTFTAVYNLQKAYVEKVIDTLNDLDNVIFEISNEETHSTTALAWERALAAYVKSYESGKVKQHPVGITKLWPGGSNSDLFASSDADWISIDDDYPTPVPDEADGSKVILWDTDHVQGLTSQYHWILQAFCQGNNLAYMDEWDGALYGSDRRNEAAYILIRRLLGDALSYAARLDLANLTPQGGLSTTGWCIAKTATVPVQLFAYQDGTGAFDVTLTDLLGTFTLEWLRVSDGTAQAGSDVAGNGVRTLTPPWAGAVAALLLQSAFGAEVSDTVTLSEAVSLAVSLALSDAAETVTLSESVTLSHAVAASVADEVTVADVATLSHDVPVSLIDGVTITETVGAEIGAQPDLTVSVTDGMTISDIGGDWWEANGTIAAENVLEHVESPTVGQAYAGAGATGAWTVAVRITPTLDTDRTIFDAETGRVLLASWGGGNNNLYLGSWVITDGSLVTSGDHVIFVVSDGSNIQAYRDNVTVGSPATSSNDIGGVARWGNVYTNDYGPFVGTFSAGFVANIALDSSQRAALLSSMQTLSGGPAVTVVLSAPSINVSDGIAVTDAPTLALVGAGDLAVSVSEGTVITESVLAAHELPASVADGITLGEAVTGSLLGAGELGLTVADGVTIGHVATLSHALAADLVDTIPLVDLPTASTEAAADINVSVSDGLVLPENVLASVEAAADYDISVVETISLVDLATAALSDAGELAITFADGIVISELVLTALDVAASVVDTIPLVDLATLTFTSADELAVSVADTAAIGEAVTRAISAPQISVADSAAVGETASAEVESTPAATVSVSEGTVISESVAGEIPLLLASTADTLVLSEEVIRDLSIAIAVADAVTVGEAAVCSVQAAATLALQADETVTITETVAAVNATLQVSKAETVAVTEAAPGVSFNVMNLATVQALTVTEVLTMWLGVAAVPTRRTLNVAWEDRTADVAGENRTYSVGGT